MYYKTYTEEQVNEISNGCGSQVWYLSWLRPPHGNFFTEPCKYHDVDYTIGGSEADRLNFDKDLKERMIEVIDNTDKDELIKEMYTSECGIPNWVITFFPRIWIEKVFKIWAIAYATALSFGGKSSFNYTGE